MVLCIFVYVCLLVLVLLFVCLMTHISISFACNKLKFCLSSSASIGMVLRVTFFLNLHAVWITGELKNFKRLCVAYATYSHFSASVHKRSSIWSKQLQTWVDRWTPYLEPTLLVWVILIHDAILLFPPLLLAPQLSLLGALWVGRLKEGLLHPLTGSVGLLLCLHK